MLDVFSSVFELFAKTSVLSLVTSILLFGVGVAGLIAFFRNPHSQQSKLPGEEVTAPTKVGWNALESVALVVAIYVAAQVVGGILVGIYLAVMHRGSDVSALVQTSPSIQFMFGTATDAFALFMVYKLLLRRHTPARLIGWVRPRFKDLFYALGGFAVYMGLFMVLYSVVGALFPKLDLNQAQDVGFSTSTVGPALMMVFISLVILPPLIEEIIVRGVLYSGLRTQLTALWAGLITSLIFAAAHLPEGKGDGLLWVGAIDTFTLSLVMVYMREKTGSLWPGMGLHALKNGVAFMVLFVFHAT